MAEATTFHLARGPILRGRKSAPPSGVGCAGRDAPDADDGDEGVRAREDLQGVQQPARIWS